jgi:hypothetical protein
LRSRPLGAPRRVLKEAPSRLREGPSRSLGGGRDRGGRERARSLPSPRSLCTCEYRRLCDRTGGLVALSSERTSQKAHTRVAWRNMFGLVVNQTTTVVCRNSCLTCASCGDFLVDLGRGRVARSRSVRWASLLGRLPPHALLTETCNNPGRSSASDALSPTHSPTSPLTSTPPETKRPRCFCPSLLCPSCWRSVICARAHPYRLSELLVIVDSRCA